MKRPSAPPFPGAAAARGGAYARSGEAVPVPVAEEVCDGDDATKRAIGAAAVAIVASNDRVNAAKLALVAAERENARLESEARQKHEAAAAEAVAASAARADAEWRRDDPAAAALKDAAANAEHARHLERVAAQAKVDADARTQVLKVAVCGVAGAVVGFFV
jgi:hypothetical protein